MYISAALYCLKYVRPDQLFDIAFLLLSDGWHEIWTPVLLLLITNELSFRGQIVDAQCSIRDVDVLYPILNA